MTETTAGALAQVTELDEERRRFESWLTQLEERREMTPPHVFARVHSDYTSRLSEVVGQLAGHAEMLRGAVADLSRRVEELRADEQVCADERAEAELRTAVGEYDQQKWSEIEGRTDATMADLVAERQQVEGEHSRLEQVLSLAVPATSTEVPEKAQLDTGTGEAETSLAASVEAGEVTTATTTPAYHDAHSEPQPPALEIVPVEALAPDETLSSAPSLAHVEPAEAPSWTSGLGLSSTSGRGGLGSPPSASSSSESERLIDQLRSVSPSPLHSESGTPHIKTLKCQECGTMNYPTEWYCERCGGELSAL